MEGAPTAWPRWRSRPHRIPSACSTPCSADGAALAPRVLVAGESPGIFLTSDLAVWAYDKATGFLDPTFALQGFVSHNGGGGATGEEVGLGIEFDAPGSRPILVTGVGLSSFVGLQTVIWKYRANGTLDGAFGSSGIVNSGRVGYDLGSDLVVESSARIIVAGYGPGSGGFSDVYISRFAADGMADTSFGPGGQHWVTNADPAGGNSPDVGNAITLDNQGRLLITGYGLNSSSNDVMVILRYIGGLADSTFGNNGVVVHDCAAAVVACSTDSGEDIAEDSRGRIVVAGSSLNDAGNLDMVIWRHK